MVVWVAAGGVGGGAGGGAATTATRAAVGIHYCSQGLACAWQAGAHSLRPAALTTTTTTTGCSMAQHGWHERHAANAADLALFRTTLNQCTALMYIEGGCLCALCARPLALARLDPVCMAHHVVAHLGNPCQAGMYACMHVCVASARRRLPPRLPRPKSPTPPPPFLCRMHGCAWLCHRPCAARGRH